MYALYRYTENGLSSEISDAPGATAPRVQQQKDLAENDKTSPSQTADPVKVLVMPKRPIPAFIRFSKDLRPSVKSKYPHMQIGQLSQVLSKMWKEITLDNKQVGEKLLALRLIYCKHGVPCNLLRGQAPDSHYDPLNI